VRSTILPRPLARRVSPHRPAADGSGGARPYLATARAARARSRDPCRWRRRARRAGPPTAGPGTPATSTRSSRSCRPAGPRAFGPSARRPAWGASRARTATVRRSGRMRVSPGRAHRPSCGEQHFRPGWFWHDSAATHRPSGRGSGGGRTMSALRGMPSA
jgi:hypothetical protein